MVYVERKHVGHTRYEVYDSHDAGLEVGTVDVILVAESLAQLFRVELLRAHGSLNQGVHERLHNLVTRQFHVQNGLGIVYALYAQLGTMTIGIAHRGRNMVDEASLERAVEYLALVLDECPCALVFKFSNGACTQIHHLLVIVGDALFVYAFQYFLSLAIVKESQQQLHGLVKRQDTQLVCVLNVHYLIADVVGSLYQVHQRMACVA